jgi:hypothetical protein
MRVTDCGFFFWKFLRFFVSTKRGRSSKKSDFLFVVFGFSVLMWFFKFPIDGASFYVKFLTVKILGQFQEIPNILWFFKPSKKNQSTKEPQKKHHLQPFHPKNQQNLPTIQMIPVP